MINLQNGLLRSSVKPLMTPASTQSSSLNVTNILPHLVSSNFLTYDSNKHVADGIWGDFVSEALENRRLKPKPDPEVVGKGLEEIQNAVDIQKKGVSAKKIIVTL